MTPIRYDIVDRQTGRVVATAKTRAAANRSVDKRDNAYGAYRYMANPVYGDADHDLPLLTNRDGSLFTI